MAEFSRQFLIYNGVPDDKVDVIMAARNKTLNETLAGYVPKADVQKQIDDAVAKVPKPDPIDPKTTEDYLKLQQERDMLRAIGGDDFASVKPKFRETVFRMLDRGEKAKAVSEQLTEIKGQYEEYFVPAEQPKGKPTFGSSDKGSMPKGEEGFVNDTLKNWGYRKE